MQLPTWIGSRTRATARRWRERAAFLVAHATTPFAGPAPNWTVYLIFVLLLMLLISILGNIVFLSIFLLAVYG